MTIFPSAHLLILPIHRPCNRPCVTRATSSNIVIPPFSKIAKLILMYREEVFFATFSTDSEPPSAEITMYAVFTPHHRRNVGDRELLNNTEQDIPACCIRRIFKSFRITRAEHPQKGIFFYVLRHFLPPSLAAGANSILVLCSSLGNGIRLLLQLHLYLQGNNQHRSPVRQSILPTPHHSWPGYGRR